MFQKNPLPHYLWHKKITLLIHKMEATLSSWILVSVYQTVWCHIPGGFSLNHALVWELCDS